MTTPAEKPQILMLGKIYHTCQEFRTLSQSFKVQVWSSTDANKTEIESLTLSPQQITEGTRKQFLNDCSTGIYDHVVAIMRTVDSVQHTGCFDAEMIASLPSSVKFICHNGAGYDQVDIHECTERGISVSNTPGVVNDATADTAMFLLLAALRRAWKPQSTIRAGAWDGSNPLGRDPKGLILGILGMGGIGMATAKRAAAFDLKLQYHNRVPVNNLVKEALGACGVKPTYVTFEELILTSDIISIHLPLSDQTRGIIGAQEIGKMKQGVIIINTARGPIINEEDLVRGLESGKIWSAGLDVFEEEPRVHPELLCNENVVLLPHIGTATVDTRKRMEVMVIDNVKSAILQNSLITQVPEQVHILS